MSSLPPADEKQAQQTAMMNLMMPLIFGWITTTLPSGLGVYYFLSNLIGMAMQYVYVGGGPFNWRSLMGLSQEPVLPKALEIRQAQLDAVQRISADEPEPAAKGGSRRGGERGEEAANGATPPLPAQRESRTSGAKRRRRYESGRRRGRR
jgi:hypothetical protein